MTSPATLPFNELAAEYDRWFEASPIFALELAALRACGTRMPRPRLEVGVGPGRFALEMGIEFGIDPALAPLHLARQRGIMTACGTGEQLPVRSRAIGSVYLLFTLCFLENPSAVLKECARILRPGGRLLIGLIPGASAWGKRLLARGRSGDPFYQHARFRTIAETKELLASHGFLEEEAWSTLRQPPGGQIHAEPPRPGAEEDAGFCILITSQQGAPK